jgi:hypothetical protein
MKSATQQKLKVALKLATKNKTSTFATMTTEKLQDMRSRIAGIRRFL